MSQFKDSRLMSKYITNYITKLGNLYIINKQLKSKLGRQQDSTYFKQIHH